MKKGAVLLLVLVFAACLFHFYYAEDHCPVHCPTRAGGFSHVHPHHGGAVCLCFWASLSGPEACDLAANMDAMAILSGPGEANVVGRPAGDVTPPPRSLLV
jgi:hypothetical protein